MLELRKLCVGYGPIDVLKGISLSVPTGSCVCLIGANGAGKTTTLSAICGLVAASSGDILFEGQPIHCVAADVIVRRGVSLVPEGRRVVSNMSVEDNLLVGAYTRRDDKIGVDLESVYRRFGRLRERRKQFAGQMSGGEQQMLAIGRALMARPRLLLLDEPSMGLAPQIVNDIFRTIREINAAGTTVLLVEQNARKALSIASYGYVLESGRINSEGKAGDLLKSPQIVAAYLGGA
ncbi:ABC transporter ATP-binding protein [Bradyrhizobium sp. BRP22]|uniref:ABC transporter ATP-binding protein n=1 Tax=Bradyrhizobium sp. BRP22 TaxID=2793821 RepID=UPI001CD33338|nr:ABC transporter ATP-binding protein [Bradyrhizobium sp. BRP22]MCA1454123.1 ABC transporter ATP-binding protein [Bradyrhizobium sp. BRP22]